MSNLNFSILLFLVIATSSILGTIIEQNENLIYYQIHYPIQKSFIPYINWKLILYLGLDHIYATWWFLSLLILFFCSLLTCTFSRQLPALRYARHWKFVPQNNKSFSIVKLLSIKSLSNIIFSLNSSQYYVFQKDQRIYAYKGLIGRIAPIFVHISIVITLLGSIIGLFCGFTAQQMIPNKEVFHIQNVIKSGLYSCLPKNILIRINDFYIEYNQDNSIKQFYSNISLLNNYGQSVKHETIYVNSPMRFHGVTFYQTEWNIDALRIKINNSVIQQKLNEIKLGNTRIWVYDFDKILHNYGYLIVTNLKDKVLVYNKFGRLVNSINIGEKISISGYDVIILELMTSTGLQIKTDPGVVIVYLGFCVLMISIMISYLSYSQIWLLNHTNSIKIMGKTNRAKLTFEEDLIIIQKKYDKFTLDVSYISYIK